MQFSYTYCPRCAGRMVERETQGRARPVCPECGLITFHNPKVAAAIIPVRDGKIALVRRGMNPGYGAWVFPGGYVDYGECVEDAASREALEEAHLSVRAERLVGVYSRNGDETVLIVFCGEATCGDLSAGDEQIDAAWFSPDELPPADQLGFWSTGAAIADWKRTLVTAGRSAHV